MAQPLSRGYIALGESVLTQRLSPPDLSHDCAWKTQPLIYRAIPYIRLHTQRGQGEMGGGL